MLCLPLQPLPDALAAHGVGYPLPVGPGPHLPITQGTLQQNLPSAQPAQQQDPRAPPAPGMTLGSSNVCTETLNSEPGGTEALPAMGTQSHHAVFRIPYKPSVPQPLSSAPRTQSGCLLQLYLQAEG